jgi:hypothetical protein
VNNDGAFQFIDTATMSAAVGADPDELEDEQMFYQMLELEEEDDSGKRVLMGRPRKADWEKTAGWKPTDAERASPTSPWNFYQWLLEKKFSPLYAINLKRLLKGTDHENDVLGFLQDKDRSTLILRGKSASPYSREAMAKGIQVAIAARSDQQWPALATLSDELRSYWNTQYVLAHDDAITYSRERAQMDLHTDLPSARSILLTHYAGQTDPFEKYGKAATLLSLYLNFWPLRDDMTGVTLVNDISKAVGEQNYIIVPPDYLTNDAQWSIMIRKAKTVGPGKKYGPIQRFIPTEPTAGNQNEVPFVMFGQTLRAYIRRNARNASKQPEDAWRIGEKPFGVSHLSNYLTKNARELKIIGSKGTFVNSNREMWDNYYYEHDRNFWGQVTLWMFHTAKASRDSYMRGDAMISCGCPDNPTRPEKRNQARTEEAAAALAAAKALTINQPQAA